jgi:hypothetical protein
MYSFNPAQPMFDSGGLIAFLAQGTNAHDRGHVVCDCYRPGYDWKGRDGGGRAVDFVMSKPNGRAFAAENVPNAWVKLDLKSGNSMIVQHYCLRIACGTYFFRNWNLEGSLDGNTWTILSRHVDDTSLNGSGATARWTISDPTLLVPFQFFRIFQTGLDSNGTNYLLIPSIELYGK